MRYQKFVIVLLMCCLGLGIVYFTDYSFLFNQINEDYILPSNSYYTQSISNCTISTNFNNNPNNVSEVPWDKLSRCPQSLFGTTEEHPQAYKGQFPYIINPKNRCCCFQFSNKVGVIVAIMSAVNSVDRRNVYRNSVMKVKETVNAIFLYLFFVGGVNNKTSEQEQLVNESISNDDIVQENYIDNYYNMTLKSLGIFRWIDQNCGTLSNSSLKFIWRITDDVYFDPELFAAHIQYNPDLKASGDLYWGYTTKNHPVMLNSQWAVKPPQVWPDRFYPDHQCGAAILFSLNTVIKLHYISRRTAMFFPDDIFICVLTKKLGITPTFGNAFIDDANMRNQVDLKNNGYRRIITDHLLYLNSESSALWLRRMTYKIDYDYIRSTKALPFVYG